MMRRHFILLFAAVLLGQTAFGQLQEDWLRLGDESLLENDPYAALMYYQKAMDMDSSRAEVNYKYADGLRLNHNYQKAAFYYFKVFRRERAKVFQFSGIYLAAMQKQSGNYTDAKQTWRRVRDQFKADQDGYWYKKAVQEMRACDLAENWMKDTLVSQIAPCADEINNDQSEFSGHFNSNGQLVFTSLRGEFNEKGQLVSKPVDYKPRLYISDTSMTTVDLMETPADTAAWIFYSKSDDGKYAAYMRTDDIQNHIYIVDSLSNLIAQAPEAGDTAWYSHPSFGKLKGQDVLFVASDRAGGKGQTDIWYSAIAPNLEWENAGANVNSIGSEITPFYRADQEKLIFASDWHYGFGGFDLFESVQKGSSFELPTNLKLPYNSAANDLYYSFQFKNKKGCITSNRSGVNNNDGTCCNDLWTFDESVPDKSVPLIASLEDLNKYLPVTLYFHNDAPDPRTRKITTTKSYLETYYSYTGLIPDYRENYRKGLSMDAGDSAEDEMDQFFTNRVDQGISDLELFAKLLATELDNGAQIEVTIKGFASPLAQTSYNVALTSRRISSLINYFDWYDRGALSAYLKGNAENGGLLIFNEIPFGEYEANQYVSDNPNESDAIYGINAAQERKIEITSVKRAESSDTQFDIRFSSEILNLGSVQQNQQIPFNFEFEKADITTISKVSSPSESVELSHSDNSISGTVSIGNLTGKQSIQIILEGSFAESPKTLHITFEVE